MSSSSRRPFRADVSSWTAGLLVGVAIGISLGIALENVAAGIGIGIAIGIAFGAAFSQSKRAERRDATPSGPASHDDRPDGSDRRE